MHPHDSVPNEHIRVVEEVKNREAALYDPQENKRVC